MIFFRRNIDEISGDRALRFYGVILAFLHVLSFLNWKTIHPLDQIFDPSSGPLICWPFFEKCQQLRWLEPPLTESVLRGYLVFAIATMALFFRDKKISAAWWALLFLNILKCLILFQDYRLRLNQHYMILWVTFAFLFIPGKRKVLMYLIVSFYFWAGTLKFTPEWISGAGLYGKKPLGVPDSLIPASCVYVIFLELVVVFGLLARNRWIFGISFVQILMFHLTSWTVVGFFYPTVMFAILSIFPLTRFVTHSKEIEGDSKQPDLKKILLFREPPAVYSVVAIFAIFQLLPVLFPGPESLTGEGRLFALHMFDAPMECRAWATVHFKDGRKQEVGLRSSYLSERIKCDPVVYFSLGKDLCRQIAGKNVFEEIDLHLETRRSVETHFTSVIETEKFCRKDLHYDLWRPNEWIRKKE